MAPASSSPYSPIVIFDVVIILFGLAITLDLRHIPSHTHATMRIASARMREQGGFSSLARIYLFLGAVPF